MVKNIGFADTGTCGNGTHRSSFETLLAEQDFGCREDTFNAAMVCDFAGGIFFLHGDDGQTGRSTITKFATDRPVGQCCG